MSFVIRCVCGQLMTAQDDYVGLEVACVRCSTALRVPEKPADDQPAPATPSRPAARISARQPLPEGVRPHRGGLAVTLGVLSILFAPLCFAIGAVLGIAAIAVSAEDLRGIQAGTVDPAGQSFASSGRIIGIIGLVISLAILVLTVGMLSMGELLLNQLNRFG